MVIPDKAGRGVIDPSRRSRASLAATLIAGLGGALLLLAPLTRAAEEKPKPPAKAPAAPAKAPAKPADPAKPASEPAKGSSSLSFSDEDLEKYHRPKPADEVSDEETTVDEEDATAPEESPVAGKSPAAGQTPGAPAPASAPARPKATPPRPNPVLGPPPVEDPLKKWKEQGALQNLREQQLTALRGKIAGLKSRLEYLHAKEDGLRNPGPPQPGSTRGPDYGPDKKPDISPGRPQPALGVIFPNLPPPQNDEDREADKSMKIPDLLDKVKAEIDTVEADLKRANDDLIEIETRAAGENSQP